MVIWNVILTKHNPNITLNKILRNKYSSISLSQYIAFSEKFSEICRPLEASIDNS